MRFGLILLSLFVLLAAPAQAQDADCTVSANYGEAISEYQLTLYNMLQMTFSTPSPIDNPDVAGAYYETLIGMRQYLETHDIPDCATTLNAVHIATVSAAQDVLALMQFESTALDDARLHFRDSWLALIDAAQTTPLS